MIHKYLDVSLTLHANYQFAAQQENQKHTVDNLSRPEIWHYVN